MKLIALSVFSAAILCTSASRISAQGPDPSAPVGTTPRLLADIAAGRKKSEKKLENAFRKAIREIDKNDHISRERAAMIIGDLKASQSAWQEFRQKQCSFLYSYYYEEIGSLGSRMAGIWEYESQLIDQRIKELENPPNYF